jgi:hypothetical protein
MTMEDRDWLDQRLASATYVPDDGFTARVVGRLAAEQAQTMKVRSVILAVAALLALALMLVQAVALARSVRPLRPSQSVADFIAFVGTHAGSFAFLTGVAVAMSVFTVALLFFARRWI